MWLPVTHPVQFCILSIIINLGVDNRTNEKRNTQSATFTIGPIRTCNSNIRELNATVEMVIQINTLNQNCLSSKCYKKLSEVYIISYCFYFVPESHGSISIGDTLEDKRER